MFHLEHVLKDRRINISPSKNIEQILLREVAYANDADFISLEFVQTQEVQKALKLHKLLIKVEKN